MLWATDLFVGGVIKFMNSNNSNIYSPAIPKVDNAYNSKTSFADTAHIVTSEEVAAANARLELLKQSIKDNINE